MVNFLCLDALLQSEVNSKVFVSKVDEPFKNVCLFLKQLYGSSAYLLPARLTELQRLLELKSAGIRIFAIESLSKYVQKFSTIPMAMQIAIVLQANLYDDKSMCRVAAIKACTEIAQVINHTEWVVDVFEEFVQLMTDEKTSVSKEALKCLQLIMIWLDTKFNLVVQIKAIIECNNL